jgi:anaerobic magnesium-protoporphyrin IX monomethyl ester cyclase
VRMKDITLANIVLAPDNQRFVPIGPLYLTSVLENAGYNVDFRDYQLNEFDNPQSVDSIAAFLENSADFLPQVLLAAKKIKQQLPDKKIILGGPGPSGVPEKILKEFHHIDIIVKGEGEKTIVELMESPGNLNRVKGISYRDGNRIYVNPPQDRIKNLDEISFPAYHKLKFQDYSYVGILSSRGCPYKCTFCEVSAMWGHRNYRRGIENVIEEIKVLKEYKIKMEKIRFNDDTFVLNREWVLKFCDSLKKENLDLKWDCMGKIDLMDSKLMEKMAESGCIGIQYGIESGSNSILRKINKGFTREVAEEVVSESVKHFEHVISTFMWGFPFETMEDFYQTIFFMSRIASIGSTITLLLLSPAPLSPLCEEYKSNLNFSEELCSNIARWEYENSDQKLSQESENITNLIKKYPEIFPDFYYFNCNNIYEKYLTLKKFWSGVEKWRPV